MAFIQIIDFHTSDTAAVDVLEKEWEAATEGKRTARKSIVAQDRDDPTRRVVIAFFDSYESAQECLVPRDSGHHVSGDRGHLLRWCSWIVPVMPLMP